MSDDRFVADKDEAKSIADQIKEHVENKQKKLSKNMNIGKLVREKMKMHRTDCSGEYVDNMGKHFTMAAEGDGYTVKYGGDAKREVSISKEQGIKLAGGCRKLELAADDKKTEV